MDVRFYWFYIVATAALFLAAWCSGCASDPCPVEYTPTKSEAYGSVVLEVVGDTGPLFTVEEADALAQVLPGTTRIVVTPGEELFANMFAFELGGTPRGLFNHYGFVLVRDTIYSCEWRDSVDRVIVLRASVATLSLLEHELLHAVLYEKSGDLDQAHASEEWQAR